MGGVVMSRTGRVILLNGTSSSGKTTIARAFQRLAPDPWLRLGIDSFWGAVDERWMEFGERASEGFRWADRGERGFEIVPGEAGQRLASGMRAAVAAAARAGNDVIADDVMLDRDWLAQWAAGLVGLETLFVAVVVPLDVLEERERLRGDRILGESRAQVDVVHADLIYDIQLDGTADPQQSATAIAAALGNAPRPRALERLNNA
jgi:chloramphenicol 3-O phosphotransferase